MEELVLPFVQGEDGITYIDMSKLHTRLQFNRVVLVIISFLVDKYHGWRFQQILSNAGITSTEDLFFEESKETLEKLLSNNLVQQDFKKYERKAEVVSIDDFKSRKN